MMTEYISLDQMRQGAAHRLEDDVEVEGFARFRVQALTGAEYNRFRKQARDDDAPSKIDGILITQLVCAHGLVQPAIAELAARDEAEALRLVNALPGEAQSAIAEKISELSNRKVSEGYAQLFGIAASPNGTAATPTLISNSV
jgi:hypothetical protein